jgi:hypothetical protein
MKKNSVVRLVAAIMAIGLLIVAVVAGVNYYVGAAQNPDGSASRPAASVPAPSETPAQSGKTASAATKAADPVPASIAAEGQGGGMAAIARASAAGKYLFIFFWKEDDENTVAMRKVIDAAMVKAEAKGRSVAVKVSDAGEKEIVTRYGVARAPMPLVLAVAPNGAVTGGFPGQFDEKALLDAFVSPGMEKCLKALQERKLVLLCVQNGFTKSNDAATKGAEDFKADARFAQFTEIVRVDPADAAESKFMAQLRIEPKTAEAVTALLAPPGAVVGTFKGAVAKDTLLAALMAATSGGCGSGGCGPSGCN